MAVRRLSAKLQSGQPSSSVHRGNLNDATEFSVSPLIREQQSVINPALAFATIEDDSLQVSPTVREIDRPQWISVLSTLQFLCPESVHDLERCKTFGTLPVRPVAVSTLTAESVTHFLAMLFGEVDILIPMVSYATAVTDNNGIPLPERLWPGVRPCQQLPVIVQSITVTSCSPYEARILQIKEKYTVLDPTSTMNLGIGLLDGSMIWKPQAPNIVECDDTGSSDVRSGLIPRARKRVDLPYDTTSSDKKRKTRPILGWIKPKVNT